MRLYSDVVEALRRGLAEGEGGAGAGASPAHLRTALIASRLVNSFRAKVARPASHRHMRCFASAAAACGCDQVIQFSDRELHSYVVPSSA